MTVVYALFVLRSTAESMSNAVEYWSHDDAPECELFPRRRELAQLVPHHILRDEDRDVVLPVMNKEPQAVKHLNEKYYACQAYTTHPTKFGKMVHERACVLIGMLFSSANRKLGNATKNGPEYNTQSQNSYTYEKHRLTLPC